MSPRMLDLGANRLLAALGEREQSLLRPWLKETTLQRGQVLFEPGDDVEQTYLPIRSTVVALLVVTTDGHEVEVANIGREGAIGGVVSSGRKPAFGRSVVQVPGAACVIATERLEEAKSSSPQIADLFSRYADILLAQLMQAAACNALHGIEERCCRWLLSTHDRAGRDLIHLTQQSLAEMLGVQRTTVSAVARSLRAQGVIRYTRGRVEVVDRPALLQKACECYGAVEAHFSRLLPDVPGPRPRDLERG